MGADLAHQRRRGERARCADARRGCLSSRARAYNVWVMRVEGAGGGGEGDERSRGFKYDAGGGGWSAHIVPNRRVVSGYDTVYWAGPSDTDRLAIYRRRLAVVGRASDSKGPTTCSCCRMVNSASKPVPLFRLAAAL